MNECFVFVRTNPRVRLVFKLLKHGSRDQGVCLLPLEKEAVQGQAQGNGIGSTYIIHERMVKDL